MTGKTKPSFSRSLVVVILVAAVALIAETVQIWRGGSVQSWLLGAVFGAAVASLVVRFLTTDRQMTGGEMHAVIAATCLAALLGIASLAGVLPPDQGSELPTPPLPGAGQGPDPTDTPRATQTAAAVVRGSRGVVLTSPADNSNVGGCQVFSGSARVPEGKTLVLAVKNVSTSAQENYFQPVRDWDQPQLLKQWSGTQYFGSGDSSVGQNYQVRVVLVDLAEVEKAMDKGGLWYGRELPRGSEVTLSIRLHRIRGAGPDACS